MARTKPIADASHKGGLVALWLLVLLAPLAVRPGAVEAFTLPKLVLAESLGLLSLILLSSAIVAAVATGGRLVRTLAGALAPILALATLGLAFTDHPLHVRQALSHLWIGAACLAGWALALPAARLYALVQGVAVPGVILSSVAILQFRGVFQPFRFGAGAHGARMEITSLAGNPADLSAFLVLPCLVAQVGVARCAGGRRWLWLGVLLVCLYGLLVPQTLTPLLALGASSLVLWAFLLPRRPGVVIGALAAVALLLVALVASPVRGRVYQAVRLLERGDLNVLLTGRVDAWRAGSWMAREHPLTGVGHGAYRASFVEAKLALATAGVEFFPGHVYPTFANAHNEIVEVMAEWGFPGLVALAWGVVLLLAGLVRASRRPPPEELGARALAWSGLVAWLVLSLAHFPFRLGLTAYPALLFLAWVVRWSAEARVENALPEGSRADPRATV